MSEDDATERQYKTLLDYMNIQYANYLRDNVHRLIIDCCPECREKIFDKFVDYTQELGI